MGYGHEAWLFCIASHHANVSVLRATQTVQIIARESLFFFQAKAGGYTKWWPVRATISCNELCMFYAANLIINCDIE